MVIIKNIISKILSHNDLYRIKIHIQGEDLFVCTRCTAMLISFLIFLLPSVLLTRFNTPAGLMAGIALLLVLIYWTLTYLTWKEILPNSNDIQLLWGILLGLAFALLSQAKMDWLDKTLVMVTPLIIIMIFHPRGGGRFINLPSSRE